MLSVSGPHPLPLRSQAHRVAMDRLLRMSWPDTFSPSPSTSSSSWSSGVVVHHPPRAVSDLIRTLSEWVLGWAAEQNGADMKRGEKLAREISSIARSFNYNQLVGALRGVFNLVEETRTGKVVSRFQEVENILLTAWDTGRSKKEFLKELSIPLTSLLNLMKLHLTMLENHTVCNDIWARLDQTRKCLPLLCSVLKHVLPLPQTKKYILDRMDLNMRLAVCGVKGEVSSEDEDQSGRFVRLVDQALDSVSGDVSLEVSCGELQSVVDEILCQAMSVAQVAAQKDMALLGQTCQKVLKSFQELRSVTCESENTSKSNCKEELALSLEALEQRVGTALLHLILQTFSDPVSLLTTLVEKSRNLTESRRQKEDMDPMVVELDLHTDSIFQVGNFAISCSTNRQRICNIRSCLLSLDSLEGELVPSILASYLNPNDDNAATHAEMLRQHWVQEVMALRDVLSTIVDPLAFWKVVAEEVEAMFADLPDKNDTVTSVAAVTMAHQSSLLALVVSNSPHLTAEVEDQLVQVQENATRCLQSGLVDECQALLCSIFDLGAILAPCSSDSERTHHQMEALPPFPEDYRDLPLDSTEATRVDNFLVGQSRSRISTKCNTLPKSTLGLELTRILDQLTSMASNLSCLEKQMSQKRASMKNKENKDPAIIGEKPSKVFSSTPLTSNTTPMHHRLDLSLSPLKYSFKSTADTPMSFSMSTFSCGVGTPQRLRDMKLVKKRLERLALE